MEDSRCRCGRTKLTRACCRRSRPTLPRNKPPSCPCAPANRIVASKSSIWQNASHMGDDPQTRPMASRAWYDASIADFVRADPAAVVGRLTISSDFTVLQTQCDAWVAQIVLLQAQLRGLDGALFMEFSIPRMGRRIDTVLIVGPIVFPLEFKVGESKIERSAIDQVWDYALDLKNFHEGSHSAAIVPILVVTGAHGSPQTELRPDADRVYRPIVADPNFIRDTLDRISRSLLGESLDAHAWVNAPYHPTPTIVEAARALYAQHSVDAIARFDAGAQNLRTTSRRIEELMDDARARQRKVIAFVT